MPTKIREAERFELAIGQPCPKCQAPMLQIWPQAGQDGTNVESCTACDWQWGTQIVYAHGSWMDSMMTPDEIQGFIDRFKNKDSQVVPTSAPRESAAA
jgi:hypothetical protein